MFSAIFTVCHFNKVLNLLLLLFQSDKPVPPGQIGSTLFLSNISDGMRQEARNQLFGVTKENLIEAAQE
jgi:hypothetical protein